MRGGPCARADRNPERNVEAPAPSDPGHYDPLVPIITDLIEMFTSIRRWFRRRRGG
jgi:hypothetical protein